MASVSQSVGLCRTCFYSEEMLEKLSKAFEASSLSKSYIKYASSRADYNSVYSDIEDFRRQYEVSGLPMEGLKKLIQLLYSLIFPNYDQSSNSNGTIIIRLLLELSLVHSKTSVVPESFECNSKLFRIHVSSEGVIKKGDSAQDVILCKVIEGNAPLCHNLMTTEFYNIPCIFVGDTDMSANGKKREHKELLLKRDMLLSRRGFDVHPMGLILNNLNVKCFLSDPQEGEFTKEFFLGVFPDIINLLKLLNRQLHGCYQSPNAKYISFFI